ncbi:hypothetical protein, partial [Mycobacterium sp. 852002-53434_SCH5985345]|uniref:hypothetical protein n=1 Tax=Mycobacterium sp. 852002-53434_SCH5985345 TaxID=1834107 RepID=UPI0018D4A88D
DTIGAHVRSDPRGWLRFASLPADLQAAEDAAQAADAERARRNHDDRRTVFDRPATTVERALLETLGYTLPATLTTRVRWLSPGVRNRSWPTLEPQGDPTS